MRTLLVCSLISVGSALMLTSLSQLGCEAPSPVDPAGADALIALPDLAQPPDLAPALFAIGAACEAHRDCGRGRSCGSAWPHGYCTIVGCRAGTCPSSSACTRLASDISYCLDTCESDDQCRLYYRCERGVCLPRCDAPGLPLCSSGFICNAAGHCERE